MNKKIIISLSVIAAVAAIVIGGTVAYFSDTETSTGNVFAAGSIDLKIDNVCRYKGGDCPWAGSNWALTDLEDGIHKFFNFGDIKPGDWGTDIISLHVYDNPAWAWFKVDNVVDQENGCTNPEIKAGDTTCGDPGAGEGELSQFMEFFIWMDDNANGIYDAGEKKILDKEVFNSCQVWRLDGAPCCEIDPFTPCRDYFVSIKWCFGTFDSNYNCHGHTSADNINIAQSDSLNMNIGFTIIQSQNNPSAEGGPSCPVI